jgi:hypothetical protein
LIRHNAAIAKIPVDANTGNVRDKAASFLIVTNPSRRERSTASPNERLTMNFTKNIGMLLLAIYLILAGLGLLFAIVIPSILMGILAIAAGVFILIGR